MDLRDRAFFATSALLYTGPLYAGLAGYGFETVPLFAAIFMLWLNVVRPGDWPQSARAWRTPRALAWPMLIFYVQMLVVAFCLVMGRAMGGMIGFQPPLPLAFTLLVSLLAISTARLLERKGDRPVVHIPGDSLSIGAGILDIGVPEMPDQPPERAFTEGVLAMLADLGPRRAPRDKIAPILDQVVEAGMVRPVLEALNKMRGGLAPHAQAQAMLALRPDVARDVFGEGLIGKAVNRALSTWVPQVVEETANDARALLKELSGVSEELPSASRLQTAANAIETGSPAAAAALRALGDDLIKLRGR